MIVMESFDTAKNLLWQNYLLFGCEKKLVNHLNLSFRPGAKRRGGIDAATKELIPTQEESAL
jgi:hypothetical protein